jgi:hypothetical protein
LSRNSSTSRGSEDGKGKRRDKMRCNNQPVQTKGASQGWTTTEATSNDNNDINHNEAGASYSKIKLCDARDDDDDNATIPGKGGSQG